ncbi:MAG TPA: adenylate/guanylate cyclase domain-containing protein [Chloroflexia bacterium]|nr:adenylate/guanylate cyclase domain-containing protein [Chloroflexia bacterium]
MPPRSPSDPELPTTEIVPTAELRSGGRQIEGERKYLTIMFADVVGSTAMAEGMDPETAREILGSAVERMLAQVERFGGTVNQVLGDGMLAFFGAPIAHEDDAERAVRAAWAIQQEMEPFGAEVAYRWGYEGFGVRVGINTGLVVLDELGSDTRVKYTAIGDAVNLTARLQSAAPPGGIVISDSTLELVRPCVTVMELGGLELKGKVQKIAAYQVTSLQESGDKVHGAPGLSSPLVGREAELAGLQEQFRAVCGGRGQVAVVMGDIGVGKSRLLAEFQEWVTETADGPVQVLQGRGQSYRQTWSYGVFIHLMRRYWGISDNATETETAAALRTVAEARLGEKADAVVPYLLRLFGLPIRGAAAERLRHLDGKALQDEMFAAVEQLMESMLVHGPVLLAIDDLHWADPTSVELLASLLPIMERRPLMIMALAWPEHEDAAERFRTGAMEGYPAQTRVYRLGPLNTKQSRTLIENLLGERTLSRDLYKLNGLIQRKAEGNPFYLQEVLRDLIEQGTLVRTPAGWIVTQDVAEMEIPNSLQAVLQARIDRLDEHARRVLQLASVIGRSFTDPLLRTLSADHQRLPRDLATLEEGDLISEQPSRVEATYVFNQGLTREVAYATILLRRRREYHGRLAAAIEQTAAGDPAKSVSLLAHHYDLSDDGDKAIQYLLRAGAQAQALYANEEAQAFYRRALARLADAGVAAPPAALQEAQTHLAEVLEATGQLAEAEPHYRAALALATTPAEQAHLYAQIASTWGWRGEVDQAQAAIEAGLALLPGQADSLEAARLRRMEATLRLMSGDYPAAVSLLEGILPTLRAGERIAELEQVYRRLGISYQLMGRLVESLGYLEQGLGAAKQRGDQAAVAVAHNAVGYTYLQMGEPARALGHLHEALHILEQRNLKKELPNVYNSLAETERALGRPEQARTFYTRSRELSTRNQQAFERGQALCGLAGLALDAEDRTTAAPLLQECAPLIDVDNELAAQYHVLQARLLLGQGALAAALEAAQAAQHSGIPLMVTQGTRLMEQIAAAAAVTP